MIKRLLLYRVYMYRTRIPISQCIQLSFKIHLVSTDAPVSRSEGALVRTHLALNIPADFNVVIAFFAPFPECFGSLIAKNR